MLTCYATCMVLCLAYGVACRWENAQRNKLLGTGEENAIDERANEFMDLTDKQDLSFRYMS
jgi:hypothetical protein